MAFVSEPLGSPRSKDTDMSRTCGDGGSSSLSPPLDTHQTHRTFWKLKM